MTAEPTTRHSGTSILVRDEASLPARAAILLPTNPLPRDLPKPLG